MGRLRPTIVGLIGRFTLLPSSVNRWNLALIDSHFPICFRAINWLERLVSQTFQHPAIVASRLRTFRRRWEYLQRRLHRHACLSILFSGPKGGMTSRIGQPEKKSPSILPPPAEGKSFESWIIRHANTITHCLE